MVLLARFLGAGEASVGLLIVAPLPLLVGRFSSAGLISVMVFALFLFNAVRGFTSGAWLPWISIVVPSARRGLFLGYEQLVLNFSILATLLASGWFLGATPEGWRYAALYFFSCLAGLVSVIFLGRPPCPMPEHLKSAPWRPLREVFRAYRVVWRVKAYRRTIRFSMCFNFAIMAVPGFLVIYLRDYALWSEGLILKLGALSTLGMMITALAWGKLSDTVGSRPVLRMAVTGQMALFLVWLGVAAGWIQLNIPLVGSAFFLMGVLGAGFVIPMIRLALAGCPPADVTIGMSLYQSCVSVMGGLSPILWGVTLELLRRASWAPQTGWLSPFAIFFMGCLALLLLSQWLLKQVNEDRALPTRRVLLRLAWDWPTRVLSEFLFDKK